MLTIGNPNNRRGQRLQVDDAAFVHLHESPHNLGPQLFRGDIIPILSVSFRSATSFIEPMRKCRYGATFPMRYFVPEKCVS
jgi:hypothetical protein